MELERINGRSAVWADTGIAANANGWLLPWTESLQLKSRADSPTRGLFLSHGDFYAATVVERLALGEEGLVRAGCACYTTEDEIDRLIEGVREIVRL